MTQGFALIFRLASGNGERLNRSLNRPYRHISQYAIGWFVLEVEKPQPCLAMGLRPGIGQWSDGRSLVIRRPQSTRLTWVTRLNHSLKLMVLPPPAPPPLLADNGTTRSHDESKGRRLGQTFCRLRSSAVSSIRSHHNLSFNDAS